MTRVTTELTSLDQAASTESVSAWQPWIVCFSAALFFFFEFMQVNMFNAVAPGIMRTFHLQALEISHLSAGYFYANVLFLSSAGMILDRVSTRRLLIAAMTLIVIATVCFAQSTVFWQAMVCRLITGMGGAFCLLSCVRLASRWFPPRRMALVVGLIVTFAMSGGMIAQTPFTLAVDAFGWRNTLLLDAAVGAVMLLIIIAKVKDYPADSLAYVSSHHQALQQLGWRQSLWRVLSNSQNWLGGIYTSLMNLPIFLLGALWGSLYLVQVRHLTRVDASYVTSMLFLGTIIGSPVLGWLSDHISRRRLPMLVAAGLALVLMCWLILAPSLSITTLLVLFFLIGFITSAQIISYPLIAESNPHFLVGSAEGIASTLIMAGGFMQTVFALLIGYRWNHLIVDQIPVYSSQNYTFAMAMMPIGFVIALLAAYKVKETFGKREHRVSA